MFWRRAIEKGIEEGVSDGVAAGVAKGVEDGVRKAFESEKWKSAMDGVHQCYYDAGRADEKAGKPKRDFKKERLAGRAVAPLPQHRQRGVGDE